jgi:hypothetical protein
MTGLQRALVVVAASIVLPAPWAWAANFPLELATPRAGMSANHRMARAYPGLEYNVRAAVVGGAYPYTYSLTNAPDGMQINAGTGEIVWLNPQASASPTLTVVDAEGSRVSTTWTITVTPDRVRFVDAVNGRQSAGNGCTTTCGAGTQASPWRTISDVYRSGAAGDVVYFRNGTYRVTDLPRVNAGAVWERVEFSSDERPAIWLAYPGERPVLNFDFRPGAENGPLVRFAGGNVYVDGFEGINSRYIAFQYESGTGAGPTFRRLRMHTLGPGLEGSNAAFIMTTTAPTPTDFMVIQDSEFYGVTGEAVTLKIYAQRKLLIEDTVHHDSTIGIELKDDVRQFTVRGSTFFSIARAAIGGNMHQTTTHGEILYNNARGGLALDLNQDGMAQRIFVYRNTLVGRVQVRNTDAADGPFTLSNNVIVNDDAGTPPGSHVTHSGVSAPSRIVLTDNLTGSPADNIVDAAGNLTAQHAASIGRHGHQRGGATSSTRTPLGLRIIRSQ